MKEWLIEHKFHALVAVMIALGGVYYFYNNGSDPSLNSSINEAGNKLQSDAKATTGNKKQQTEANQQNQEKQQEKIMIDVKGQIKNPGVYQSSQGERVMDVINRAGGLTDKADESQINFAEHVQDEMVIYIPVKGEAGPGASVGSVSSLAGGSPSNKQAKIDLNKADANELQNIPGIGPAKAASIIEYREKSGPFKTIEDLKNISGIGDKTFEKLKDLIVVH